MKTTAEWCIINKFTSEHLLLNLILKQIAPNYNNRLSARFFNLSTLLTFYGFGPNTYKISLKTFSPPMHYRFYMCAFAPPEAHTVCTTLGQWSAHSHHLCIHHQQQQQKPKPLSSKLREFGFILLKRAKTGLHLFTEKHVASDSGK